MQRAKKLIHYEEAQRLGIYGDNLNIAFLDSGIAPHPDLEGKVLAFHDFVNGRKKPYDDTGHGTHVCGIATGTGMKSQGLYSGIAPHANIIMAKVLNERAEGKSIHMIEAIEWLIDLKEHLPIHILNISIAMKENCTPENENRIIQIVDKAWEAGILVVCATGNNGPFFMSLSPMAMSSKVISVGCHDKGYVGKDGYSCEEYSGRGPSKYDIKKPDIVAPGTDIVSCSNQFMNKQFLTKNRGKGYYIAKNGTSMAAPMVSGAAALAMEYYHTTSNEDIKKRIVYSTDDLHEIWAKQGWGMLNIKKLLNQTY